MKEMFVKSGLEVKPRDDSRTCWTIKPIVSDMNLKNFR